MSRAGRESRDAGQGHAETEAEVEADCDALFRELREILGADGLLTRPDELYIYSGDASIDRARPPAVTIPADAGQLAAVVATLRRFRRPITGRGAGTGLSGGAVPADRAVVVSTARLRRLHELDERSRLVRVDPGLANLTLNRKLARSGFSWAPDPSSQRTCTIGGNIAENAGGPHCLKHGVTLHHLASVTVHGLAPGAAGEGSPAPAPLILGGPGCEAPGLDLLALFCGSEGTLGIISEATLRVTPAAEATETLLLVFASLEAACEAVTRILDRAIVPAALELLDKLTISAVEAVISAGYPESAEAVLLVDLEGLVESLPAQRERLLDACSELAIEVRTAADAAERARLWRGRKEAVGAVGKLAPNYYIQDGCLPRSRLPELLPEVVRIAEREGLRVANVFHAGDGNLHPVLVFDARVPGEVERVIRAGTDILRLCVEAGGTITGEHGVGLEKRHAIGLLFSDDDLSLFRAVRSALDPAALFNPGKLIPTPGRCLEGGRAPREAPEHPPEEHPPEVRHRPPPSLPTRPRQRAAPGFEAELIERLRGDGGPIAICGRKSSARPPAERALIELAGHSGILELAPADLYIRARAGTPVAELDAAVAKAGLRAGLPVLSGDGTLGGRLALRPGGGQRRGAHGSCRETLLGLRFLRSDGTIHELGGRVPKNVAGYDLGRLLLGSCGALAIILEATLALRPRRPAGLVRLRGSLTDCLDAADELDRSRQPFSALSLVSPTAGGSADGWQLIAGFEDERDARRRLDREVCDRARGRDLEAESVTDPEQAERELAELDRAVDRLARSAPEAASRRLRIFTRPGALGPLLSSPALSGAPVIASRRTGLIEALAPLERDPGLRDDDWRRVLDPREPADAGAPLDPRLAELQRAIKRAFDPESRLPDLPEAS